MRYKLLKQAIRRQAKKHPRESRFVTYEKACSILLLFDSKGNDEPVYNIIRQLRQDNKEVTAWGFSTGKPSPAENPQPDVHVFNKRDTGRLSRKPKKSIRQKVCAKQYDLLLNLSAGHSLPLLYLSLLANASLKAGIKTDLRLFDFMLDIENTNTPNRPADEAYLFNEIIFYLKSIQTTD